MRLLGDRVLQNVAWKTAGLLSWVDTFDAGSCGTFTSDASGDWLGAGRYGEPGVVAPLTAGNLKAPGPYSSPARGLVLPGQASGSLRHPGQARRLQGRLLFRTTVLTSR